MDADQIEELDECISKRNKELLAFADKVAALSAGALTLTVAFRNQVAADTQNHRPLVAISWCGFAVAALIGTFLHLYAAHLYGKRIRDITRGVDDLEVAKDWRFQALYIAMSLGFILGFSTLTAFGLYNFQF